MLIMMNKFEQNFIAELFFHIFDARGRMAVNVNLR